MIRLKVAALAKEKGFSRNLLSHVTQLDIKTIRRMCDEPEEDFSTYSLNRVAWALGVHVSELYDYFPDQPPPNVRRRKPK